MSDYPLQIEHSLDIEGCGPICDYYSKGHHDPDVFIAAVDHDECILEDYERPAHALIRHEYWRNVPLRGDDYCDGVYMQFVKSDHPGPGAYPVTALFQPDLKRRHRETAESEEIV